MKRLLKLGIEVGLGFWCVRCAIAHLLVLFEARYKWLLLCMQQQGAVIPSAEASKELVCWENPEGSGVEVMDVICI